MGAFAALYVLAARTFEFDAAKRAEGLVSTEMGHTLARLAALGRRAIAVSAKVASESALAIELLLTAQAGSAVSRTQLEKSVRALLGDDRPTAICSGGRVLLQTGLGPPGLRNRFCARRPGALTAARIVAVDGKVYHVATAPVVRETRLIASVATAHQWEGQLPEGAPGNLAVVYRDQILGTNLKGKQREWLAQSVARLRTGAKTAWRRGDERIVALRQNLPRSTGLALVHVRSATSTAHLRSWRLAVAAIGGGATLLAALLLFLGWRLERDPPAAAVEPPLRVPADVSSRMRSFPAAADDVPDLSGPPPAVASRGDPEAGAPRGAPSPGSSRAAPPPPVTNSEHPPVDKHDDEPTRIEAIGAYRYVRDRTGHDKGGGEES